MHSSGKGGNRIDVIMYQGTKEIDDSKVGKWDSEDMGKVVWDEEFNLSPKENQKFLYDLCFDL